MLIHGEGLLRVPELSAINVPQRQRLSGTAGEQPAVGAERQPFGRPGQF
jgi:hypothetical protein